MTRNRERDKFMLNPKSRRSFIQCCSATRQKQSPATEVARRHSFRSLMAVAARAALGCVFLLGGAFCQGQSTGGPVVTPATGAVFQGQTVTLTSQKPVTWTLVNGSYGTLTVNSSTSATFTAPATAVTPNHVLAGCQAAPNDTVWNTRVDSLPLETNSATWITTLGTATSNLGYSLDFGTNVADHTTPVTNESFSYTPLNNGTFVTPKWPNLKRQGGVFTSTKTGDHHTLTVDTDNCTFYETYQDFPTPQACGGGTCTAESGVAYRWSQYSLPNGSTDAASLLYAPTMLHLSEIKAGAVNHVLKFVLGRDLIRGGSYAKPYWPSLSGNSAPYGGANALPYGARLRLRADFDISGFSPEAQVILTALKQYGMILSDATNPGYEGPQLVVNTDATEDPPTKAALDEIAGKGINGADFEAVNESSFIVSQTSSEVNPMNGYETPNGYSVVTATDPTDPTHPTTVPIAVENNFPSVLSPTLYIVAGTYHDLTFADRAGHYAGAKWSLVSGVGSVTTTGEYRPPASVSVPTSAVLKVTSDNIPDEYSMVYVTVLPKSSDGNLRIDAGSTVATKDAEPIPFTWQADQGYETATYIKKFDYPTWMTASPERVIYMSSGYTYGDDLVYSLAVANGNYMVRLMFGQPYNGTNCPSRPCRFNPLWHAPLNLEANGQIGAHSFDFGTPIDHEFATPSDALIPAQVTNGSLTVALRADISDALAATGARPTPLLNGLEIIPDNSAPHIAIDAQQQTAVPAGSTLQLYSVGWYMSNAVTWSIASGPGTIDQSGLYTAPGSQSSQPVTIQATSTVNSKLTATVTLTIPAGS